MELERLFYIKPIEVLEGEFWECNHSITNAEIYCIVHTEPREEDKIVSIRECYKLRWMEQSWGPDTDGRYWLKNTSSIRTPLHIWAKSKGLAIQVDPNEISLIPPNSPF